MTDEERDDMIETLSHHLISVRREFVFLGGSLIGISRALFGQVIVLGWSMALLAAWPDWAGVRALAIVMSGATAASAMVYGRRISRAVTYLKSIEGIGGNEPR